MSAPLPPLNQRKIPKILLRAGCASLLALSACDCGTPRPITVEVPMTVEAGPDTPMPDETRAAPPIKLESHDDEASAERTVEQLKALGLGHLIDGGAAH